MSQSRHCSEAQPRTSSSSRHTPMEPVRLSETIKLRCASVLKDWRSQHGTTGLKINLYDKQYHPGCWQMQSTISLWLCWSDHVCALLAAGQRLINLGNSQIHIEKLNLLMDPSWQLILRHIENNRHLQQKMVLKAISPFKRTKAFFPSIAATNWDQT
jgi:hypothetical protein